MTYRLEDVKKRIEEFETIWKCRVISGCINQDITDIPTTEIIFKRLIPESSIISGFSISSNTNRPKFSFYAKDINPDKIEIDEDTITIYLKPEGKILIFCTSPFS